ncbi:Nucleotidylyl transferase [Sodiomyces alkalinus F11]|uniref:Nucleotidylyl transferase n=1 Tax=Sodiomyces alkalinus (strain CBS 110278 / VKM F-3762 / F11) TaxID=1314773 RepID=A0A3N2Q6J3_SODAK|nr:Nucleotidylyl transferase [Sodiomyces alkalinus F11]ROT42384.1 Nucleotidylyl transferase [Sodiomyces alkalinus F11]
MAETARNTYQLQITTNSPLAYSLFLLCLRCKRFDESERELLRYRIAVASGTVGVRADTVIVPPCSTTSIVSSTSQFQQHDFRNSHFTRTWDAKMSVNSEAARQELINICAQQLSSFQRSGDAFCIFSKVTAGTGGVYGEYISHIPPAPSIATDLQQQSPRTLFVLDSSFNPPTLAHMRMAASAIRSTKAKLADDARLLLLLAVNNADKAPKPAAFPLRMAMMQLFAQDLITTLTSSSSTEDVHAEGLTIDLGLTTGPYFHEKSRVIAESGLYPSQTEQVFLAGYDTLIRIFNPKYYGAAGGMREALEPFLGRSRLRITMRTDDAWGGREDQLAYVEGLRDGGLEDVGGLAAWCDRVDLVDGDEEAVSSTKVREAAKSGDGAALEKLVSPRVKVFVISERLYAEEK